MTEQLLPDEFSDLEGFAREWVFATPNERYAKRLASSIEEMQAFYDAALARGEAIISFCDRFDVDQPPAQVLHLMQLMYALVIVSFAIEVWKQPRVVDSGAITVDMYVYPPI